MRGSLFVAAALIASIAVAGEPQQRAEKRVWQIDDAERIARRFEPGAAAIRRSRAIALGRTDVRDDYNFVLGSENPELLMPWELMGYVQFLYHPSTELQRDKGARIRQRAATLGFGPEFLERLRAIAQPWMDADMENRWLQRKQRTMAENDPAAKEIGEGVRRTNALLCPGRAAALVTARRELGQELFDRFLYEAVAPDAVGTWPNGDGDALLWLQEGCR